MSAGRTSSDARWFPGVLPEGDGKMWTSLFERQTNKPSGASELVESSGSSPTIQSLLVGFEWEETIGIHQRWRMLSFDAITSFLLFSLYLFSCLSRALKTTFEQHTSKHAIIILLNKYCHNNNRTDRRKLQMEINDALWAITMFKQEKKSLKQ